MVAGHHGLDGLNAASLVDLVVSPEEFVSARTHQLCTVDSIVKVSMKKQDHVKLLTALLMVVGLNGLPGLNAPLVVAKEAGSPELVPVPDLIQNLEESIATVHLQRLFLEPHHHVQSMEDGANGPDGHLAQYLVDWEEAFLDHVFVIAPPQLTVVRNADPILLKQRTALLFHARLMENGPTGVNGADALSHVEKVNRQELGCVTILNLNTAVFSVSMMHLRDESANTTHARLTEVGQAGHNGQIRAFPVDQEPWPPANVVVTILCLLTVESIVLDLS